MEEKVESVQGNILRQMFPWQTELINEYVKLDSLPHHPLDDLNSKQNQRTLKEFINNFIEELSEAYQELVMMLDHIEKNEKSQAKEHLIKYNEEIADAWHFFLEFLVYADYREDKLDMLSKNFCDATSFPYHEDRPFTTLLGIGSFTNKAV